MKFDGIVESMREDIIKTTQELVRLKSVETAPAEGAPFGTDMRKCLDRTLAICEEMGFKTQNFDGYAGHAECGEGEDIVGILVHVDVVPEGSGWSSDPYGAEIVDGKIIGRGTIDDKGPAVAAMYALKAVKDAGEKFNKRVRIIVGCDEESGRWACMNHYFKFNEMPVCGFSPDADFPIINSEKGILIFHLNKSFAKKESSCCEGLSIKSLKGGTKVNSVPDYCECELVMKKDFADRILKTVEYVNEKLNMKLTAEINGDSCIVKAYGLSAHGSTPEKGINAVAHMISFLNKLPLCTSEQTDYIKFLDNHIGQEVDGRSFGLNLRDDVSGTLNFNLGIIDLDEEKGSVSINIRYPVTKTRNDVYDVIKAKIAEYGISLVEGAEKDPLYVPADNFMIKKLQQVYEDVTGCKAELISIGGGTYARAIKNAVAFGPLFPGKEETAHQKNEYIEIEDLIKCAKIYAEAIYELVK